MLKVCIKKNPRPDTTPKISLKKIASLYFNKFYLDLNTVLSDYRSIQEYSNRNKIIEFVGKKVRGLDLFFMLVKGAYGQGSLRMRLLRQLDCIEEGTRMVEIADFMAGMFENMKTSFIPRHDFGMALQAFIDPAKLLARGALRAWAPEDAAAAGSPNAGESIVGLSSMCLNNNEASSAVDALGNKVYAHEPSAGENASSTDENGINFEEIHRLMRIYLIKETIEDYEIGDGLLQIHFEHFSFELALCGECNDPQWKVLRVHSAIKSQMLETHLIKRLPPVIADIQAFAMLYKSRKNALDVFNSLKGDASGFYQNFTGKIGDTTITGRVKDSRFFCDIERNGERKMLVDRPCSDILGAVDGSTKEAPEAVQTEGAYFKDFNKEGFGENYTFYAENLFLCFPVAKRVFYIGEYPNGCGLRYSTVHLRVRNGRLVGDTSMEGAFIESIEDRLAEAEREIGTRKGTACVIKGDGLGNTFIAQGSGAIISGGKMGGTPGAASKKRKAALPLHVKDGRINAEQGFNFLKTMKPAEAAESPGIENYLQAVKEFVERNRGCLAIFYKALCLGVRLEIDERILSDAFVIRQGSDASADSEGAYTIVYDTMPGLGSLADFSCPGMHGVIAKAMLIALQADTPDGFAVIEKKAGEKIMLEINNIRILITDKFKTDLKFLTKDCERFSFSEALEFTKNFGCFYRSSLLPTALNRHALVFSFYDLTGEDVVVTRAGDGYKISGSNLLRMLQLGSVFDENDTKAIVTLYRAYLINRFHSIKRLLRIEDGDKNLILMPSGCKIQLTPEGLKFFGEDGGLDNERTRILNTERSFLGCLDGSAGALP